MTEVYSDILTGLKNEGRLREIPRHRKGGMLKDLCSNDYMGLARRADEWKCEFSQRFSDIAMTSSASRLLASDQNCYKKLESYLEEIYGRPALLFNSGYHANVGIIQALNTPGTLWLTDKLIHASAIDGIRLSSANCKRWKHNDVAHLRKIIEIEYPKYDQLIVVCESIYSMDGDIAPLRKIAELKKDFPEILLYVDEAHAIGTIGKNGAGVASAEGIANDFDIIVGTFGKTCASAGAFVVCHDVMKQYLVNTARSLIFSTALPPINVAWSLLMLEKLRNMDEERNHLNKISDIFRKGIESITGIVNPSASAIVPLMIGDADKAVLISKKLEERGILALPIRRPTVPPGGERIRFSLNACLSEDEISNMLQIISEVWNHEA